MEIIKIKDIDHQRGVASSQVLLHQSKSEPVKPMMMMITMITMSLVIMNCNQIQLNIYPVETLRGHHMAAAYAALTLSVKCAPAVQE